MEREGFSARLIAWQEQHGRHDLPWQNTQDPYRIWVSEIMLQQTQVQAVIPFYQRFMARFPDITELALAPVDEIMAHWSGLGYYARARNLHKTAQTVVLQGLNQLPTDPIALEKLPGIGRSTAAAIAVFSSGRRAAILDGNVKRVLARHFAIPGFPGTKAVETTLWSLAESLLPNSKMESYTQGLMDLGATLCTRSSPRCERCPLHNTCAALRQDRVDHYPEPRPSKPRVERHAKAWLIRRGKEEILLEQRPARGIWGGLWCLPEAVPEYLQSQVQKGGEPILIEHNFTHFRLFLTVEPVKWNHPEASQDHILHEPGMPHQRWFTLEEALSAGLPAPLRTLLKGLERG